MNQGYQHPGCVLWVEWELSVSIESTCIRKENRYDEGHKEKHFLE